MSAVKTLFAALSAFMAASLPAGAQAPAPVGAASCSGCHAPPRVASPLPPLAGRDPKDIVAAMQEFRSGQREATIMNRIAKGFSDDEIQAIAAWIGQQR